MSDPQSIGKYRIVEKIGEGGMGKVYKAQDPVLGRSVAIKVFAVPANAEHPERDGEMHERFMREARLIGSLQHKNIVMLFDFGEIDKTLFMVMELLDGTDLKAVIKNRSPLSHLRKIEIFHQICEALAYAHERGVVHRDIKPSNIHLLPNGDVKLMDFGLARMADSSLTKSGTVMGTPYYMSPEQIRGSKVDARSDLFSIGCVIYELLVGQRPFRGQTTTSILTSILTTTPQPPRSLDPSVPGELESIVLRCMAKDPRERYSSAISIQEDLDRLVEETREKLDQIPSKEFPTSPSVATKELGIPAPQVEAHQAPVDAPLADVFHATPPRIAPNHLPEATLAAATLTRPPLPRRSVWPLVAILTVGAIIALAIGVKFHAKRASPEKKTERVPEQKSTPQNRTSNQTSSQPVGEKSTLPGSPDTGASSISEQTPAQTQPVPETVPVGLGPHIVEPPLPAAQGPRSRRVEPGKTGSLQVRIVGVDAAATTILVLIDGDAVVTSDPTLFLLEDLTPGQHSIHVRCEGYEPVLQPFTIREGEEAELRIEMRRI